MDAGIVLYKLAKEFDLSRSTTEERLCLQKTIYLLQASGFRIGYGFSWYRYGPYSQELVYDSYRALYVDPKKYAEETGSLNFSEETQEKLDRFKKALQSDLSKPRRLELLASVDFVRRTWLSPEASEDEVVGEFKRHKKRSYDGHFITDAEISAAKATLDQLKQALSD